MYFSLVWKNLRCRPGRSLLTLAGVAVGVAAGVAMFGVARGFERDLLKKYAARDTQMIVTGATKKRPLPTLIDAEIGGELAKLAGVTGVAGALYDIQSLEGSTAVGVLGWQPGTYLWDHLSIRSGSKPGREGGGEEVVLGRMAAAFLKKGAGDSLAFETETHVPRVFRVAGEFESAALSENASAIMSLELLQSLLDCPGKVNYFNLRLDPQMSPEQFEALRETIRSRYPDLNVLKADEIAGNNTGIRVARAMSTATSIIALLIGILGVMNSVLMSVFERSREIGLLMAVGWKVRRVAGMVLIESLALCLGGAAVGVAVAVAGISTMQQMEFLRGKFSAEFGADLIAAAFLVAAGAGLLGGLYPAVLASSYQPSEALRHE